MHNEIIIEAIVNASLDSVWQAYNEPVHIMNWNAATEDWHCTNAENNLKIGGTFSYTMAAKDGSHSFNFMGKYTQVEHPYSLAYLLDDGRRVSV